LKALHVLEGRQRESEVAEDASGLMHGVMPFYKMKTLPKVIGWEAGEDGDERNVVEKNTPSL